MKPSTAILIVCVAMMAVSLAVIVNRMGSRAPEAAMPDAIFASLAERADEAARIRIENEDGVLEIVRDGDGWVLPALDGYPVTTARVRELVLPLSTLSAVSKKTANPENHDRLSVQAPVAPSADAPLADGFATVAPTRVLITDNDGETLEDAILGEVRTVGGAFRQFVRHGDEDQAWEANGRVEALANPMRWVAFPVAEVPRNSVRAVTINRAGAEPVVISKAEESTASWAVSPMPEGREPAAAATLGSIAGAFGYLTATAIRSADDGVERPIITTIETFGGERYTVSLPESAEGGPAFITIEYEAGGGEGGNARAEDAAPLAGWAFEINSTIHGYLTSTSEEVTEAVEAAESEEVGPFVPGSGGEGVLVPADGSDGPPQTGDSDAGGR